MLPVQYARRMAAKKKSASVASTAAKPKRAAKKAAASTAKKAPPKKTGAKRAARKPAKKVSAAKQTAKVVKRIEDYVATLSGWQAKVALEILELIKSAAPYATAAIKWGQPVFEANGPFAYFRPAKNHITFGFWRGKQLKDPKKLLESAGDRMAHIKLSKDHTIDAATLIRFVKEAVQLNAKHGNPTQRG